MSSKNLFAFLLVYALQAFGAAMAKNMGGPMHAFHTSLTQIQYNTSTKSWEVSVRVFTDDLEKALRLYSHTNDLKIEQAETQLKAYLNRHFSASEGKRAATYIGKETEADVIWLYLELPGAGKKLGLKNTLLNELFPDQMNIVNVQKGGQKNSFLLKSGSETAVWEAGN